MSPAGVFCYVGSPMTCEVVDFKCVHVNCEPLRMRRVGEVVHVDVTTDGSAIDEQISCSVAGK